MNTDELKTKVELFGVWFEKRGWQPVAGRIFGYLLLSNPPYHTMEELQDFLQISKSSVSTNLKNLMNERVVNYITFPGDRKRYFQIDTENWLEKAKHRANDVSDFADILNRTLDNRNDAENMEFNQALRRVANFYQHLSDGISKTVSSWDFELNYN